MTDLTKNTDMQISKHFSYAELQCPKTGTMALAEGFINELEELREAWGHPMIVNSCCRSEEHNKEVGGVENSYHIFNPYRKTCAIDIDIQNVDGEELVKLIWLAGQKGWSIGVSNYFIHLDKRDDYDDTVSVCFSYGKEIEPIEEQSNDDYFKCKKTN